MPTKIQLFSVHIVGKRPECDMHQANPSPPPDVECYGPSSFNKEQHGKVYYQNRKGLTDLLKKTILSYEVASNQSSGIHPNSIPFNPTKKWARRYLW